MTDHVTSHQAQEDARNASILIYVDGRIVPRAEATISVYDSGFMLGDGLWEGLRLYNGRWAFLDDHMAIVTWGLICGDGCASRSAAGAARSA